MLKKYGKGIASLAVTALTLIVGASTAGHISAAEWLTIIASLIGTIAVVGVPNTPTSPALKAVAQALGPILGGVALAIATPDGLSWSVVLNLAISAAGVAGVYAVPNVGDAYARRRAPLRQAF